MIKIGCCGYPTSMKKYYGLFKLVELNTTFYQYPRFSTVEGWRQKGRENFEFTVKANQEITHKSKMEFNDASQTAFEKMKQICKALKAKILLFQTPASFKPEKLETARFFFEKVNRENLILVWETRGPAWETPETRDRLAEALKEVDVSHVVDPFRSPPAYTSRVAYFRLHGLGERLYYYQYTDEELKRLKTFVEPFQKSGLEVYVLFNNLAMFQDAVRFQTYLETGEFPKITAGTGLESIKEVVSRTRYPVSKSMLVRKLGWKLVEIREKEQIRLNELLKNLPSKTYENVEEVIREIKRCSLI
ncbi:MAG TPA: DUF72 domain-containing protein [Candidatus Bathyarchaeota archaeon]|nr:DUF72 domain-containing protein [Candidatus Bathyarchaeota archaeon]